MKLEFDENEFIKFVESLYHNQKNYYLGCCVGDGSRIRGGAVWIILNAELKKKNGTAILDIFSWHGSDVSFSVTQKDSNYIILNEINIH